jgi:hypothetical protein
MKWVRSLLGVLIILSMSSWGFYAHRLINEMAVYTLPSRMSSFFKQHREAIRLHAVDPDKRCYTDSLESARHYIDLDDQLGPIDSIPIHWSEAVAKFEERKLRQVGIIPWQIYRSYLQLVKAMNDQQSDRIIRIAAELGHYIGDAHVPLHTTKNYNGQLTQQTGIHAFWESRIPELYAKDYNFMVGRAIYIPDVLAEAWIIIRESNAMVDSVLQIEAQLDAQTLPALKFVYEIRNNRMTRSYSPNYAKTYQDRLNGMIERRMRASVRRIGNLWFSAWIDAGQPPLASLSHRMDQMDSLSNLQEGKRIIGRTEWH